MTCSRSAPQSTHTSTLGDHTLASGDHGCAHVEDDNGELEPPPQDVNPCDGAANAPSQPKSGVSLFYLQEGTANLTSVSRGTTFPNAKFTTPPSPSTGSCDTENACRPHRRRSTPASVPGPQCSLTFHPLARSRFGYGILTTKRGTPYTPSTPWSWMSKENFL